MRYDDVLTADLRRELVVWRAATGVPAVERSLVGPPPNGDSEAVYHRNLTNRINARYGEALHAWQERIVAYVGHRDEQTGQLANYLDGLQRKGVNAERILELAVAPQAAAGRPPDRRPFLPGEGSRRTGNPECGSCRRLPPHEALHWTCLVALTDSSVTWDVSKSGIHSKHEVEGCPPRAR